MDFVENLLEIGHNRPGTRLTPQGIVLHSTATPGATALQERNYFNTHVAAKASAHVFVDWTQAMTTIPWKPGKAEIAWHAGPTANHRFLGIECCETNDPDLYAAGLANFVEAACTIIDLYGWPVDDAHVWSHNRISATFHETDHTDPIPYLERHHTTWEDLLAAVAAGTGEAAGETGAEQPPAASGPLSQGAVGPQVAAVQQLLQAKGFDVGPIDGIFGPQTQAAVMAFQEANGLLVNGVVGPQTLAALRA